MFVPARLSQPARVLLTAVLSLASFGSASAQETRGTIFGTVKDTSGGVLAGMSVVVVNEDTNVSNETVTNERGGFEIPYLAARFVPRHGAGRRLQEVHVDWPAVDGEQPHRAGRDASKWELSTMKSR